MNSSGTLREVKFEATACLPRGNWEEKFLFIFPHECPEVDLVRSKINFISPLGDFHHQHIIHWVPAEHGSYFVVKKLSCL